MNRKTLLPNLLAVLLACGVLGVLWFGNRPSPANSTPVAVETASPDLVEAAVGSPAPAPEPAAMVAEEAEIARGKEVYKEANCIGCHKWHGDGGGGYGGAALSLRDTILNLEQIIEIVACGRPGTGMPAFHRRAYKGYDCYGMTLQDLGEDKPPSPAKRLNEEEIARVAAFVAAKIKDKGPMTKAQCEDFWGAASRECERFE